MDHKPCGGFCRTFSSHFSHHRRVCRFIRPYLFVCLIYVSYGAGGNTATHTIMSAKKLDDATEAGTIAKVDKSLSKAIMQARTAKKLSQKDLATAINEKATTIQQYESGKAIPNPQIIGKLERKLGCKLPRPGKSKAAPKDGKKPAPKAGPTRGGPPKRR